MLIVFAAATASAGARYSTEGGSVEQAGNWGRHGGVGRGSAPLILCISAQASRNLFAYFKAAKWQPENYATNAANAAAKSGTGSGEGGVGWWRREGGGGTKGGAAQHALKESEVKRCAAS